MNVKVLKEPQRHCFGRLALRRCLRTSPALSEVFYCLLNSRNVETAHCSGQQQHKQAIITKPNKSPMLRRSFLAVATFSGLGALSLGLPRHSSASSAAQLPQTLDPQTSRLAGQFAHHLQQRGYQRTAPHPLVTGHPFNGGLQYDDEIQGSAAGRFVIQPAARVEDITKKDRIGVLPLFHIINSDQSEGSKGFVPLDQTFDFLIRRLGLEPGRMRFTGTERALPLIPLLARHGVEESQLRLVDWDEARALGTGSGYFEPQGHPRSPSFNTLSFEYLLADGSELEIGEFTLTDARPAAVRSAGFGLERLTIARGDRPIRWQEALPSFRSAVELDAGQQGLPLPKGYYEILNLPASG